MKKTILFPFDINDDNREDYCRTLRLAEQQQADLICFTVLENKENEDEINEAYFHLLSLNGYYQNENGWTSKPAVFMKKIIQYGNMIVDLKKLIREVNPNWIVSHQGSSNLNRKAIEKALPITHDYPHLPIIL